MVTGTMAGMYLISARGTMDLQHTNAFNAHSIFQGLDKVVFEARLSIMIGIRHRGVPAAEELWSFLEMMCYCAAFASCPY